MADKRTVYPIPADTWVLILPAGATAAKVRKRLAATYYSMIGTLVTDVPTGIPSANPTSERMSFDSADDHFVSDSAPVFMWVRCSPGQVGSLIVTL